MSSQQVFQGLEFFIDLDERDPDADTAARTLVAHLSSRIGRMGGKVAGEYHEECTHVVLRHEEQELYVQAHQNEQSVVSVEYLVRCCEQGKRLQEYERGIFKSHSIPGITDHVREVTLTAFRGWDRLVYRYKCESMGAPYAGVMTVPGATSHLVVKDLTCNSEKVNKAKKTIVDLSDRFKSDDDHVADSSQEAYTDADPVPGKSGEGSGVAAGPGAATGTKAQKNAAEKKKADIAGSSTPRRSPRRTGVISNGKGQEDAAMDEGGKSGLKSDHKARDKWEFEGNSPMGPSGSQKKGVSGKQPKQVEDTNKHDGDESESEGEGHQEHKKGSSGRGVGVKRKFVKGGSSRGPAAKKRSTTQSKAKEEASTEPSESESKDEGDNMEEDTPEPPSPKPRAEPKNGSKRGNKSKPQNRMERSDEVLFAVSGMEGDERRSLQVALKKLGVDVSMGADPHAYDVATTHIIQTELRRNEKTMCAMAAGKWILGSAYVKSCRSAGDLVDEEPFELSKTPNGVISEGAPAHWRNRFDNLGVGAFDGVNACFYGKLGGPGNEVIQKIIKAGGGKVLKKSPPYADILKRVKINVAVIASDKAKKSDRNIKVLLEAGVACVSTDYIINWVAHPDLDLAEFVLLDPEGGCEALVALENGRGAANADSDNSVSF